MIDLFQVFNEEETALLLDSIPLITVLIAGADGNIDKHEKDWGAKLTKIRSYAKAEVLQDFYTRVEADYSEKVETFISEYPDDTDQRTAAISEKLSGLNALLAKLDQLDAYILYSSFTSFAEHVAKASGGFLRMGAINKAEKDLIGLPMLTVIEKPVEEDEEEA